MKKSKKVRMTFIFPDSVETVLRDFAEKSGLKMSKIVERAVLNYIKTNENTPN